MYIGTFFSYHIPAILLRKKNDIVGIFIFILCQLLSQLAKKTKFILKLLGNPQIDAFFAISARTGKPIVVMGGPQQLLTL